MADNRKYYYLKLKESYFDDDSIILLESMQDGILYSYILLKLYLKSLKHDGKLQLDEHIPYNAQMIATITRQQVGTIERALQIYEKLGLVEILEDSTVYMSNIELFIGKSSTEGERKRRARNGNIKQKQLGGQMSTPILDICPPEIERELEKGHHTQFYGKYQNISLTDEELEQLKQELPSLFESYIEKLSEYMASTGKTYNSHVATIRRWAKEDVSKNTKGSQRANKGEVRNYDYKGNNSL